jgi:hypothetical protein
LIFDITEDLFIVKIFLKGYAMPKYVAFAFILFTTTQILAEESTTRDMSFEDCLRTIRKVASDLGVAPINIVETDILRIVRFLTSDGSVLVTCSKPDNKLIITKNTE